jgi:outer membrane receptor protein involved in Fe transport
LDSTLLGLLYLALLIAAQAPPSGACAEDAASPESAHDAALALDAGSGASADTGPDTDAGLTASAGPDARVALTPEAGLDGAASELTPPRALFLPLLSWPPDQPRPELGSVDARVVIERDGQAQLESCEQAASVCSALRAALALAKFAPATLNGEPKGARVRVRFGLEQTMPVAADAGAADASGAQPQAGLPNADAAAAAADDADASTTVARAEHGESAEYGAVARVERPKPLATAVELEEIREVPGALGDPFRVIEALPGVVPVMTGLPYVYVRGAPPAATAYFYDDIQLPALFHLALGPAVVHPAMVGGIDFYPGVAPARYGRKTGGVVAGKALLRDLKPGVHGELELRLIDMQAYVATPIRKTGRLEIAGRYGYPGLLTKLFESRAVVQYWDYQLRSVIPLSRRSEATLIAIGSFDLIGTRRRGRVERDLELSFHRVEARLVQRSRGLTLGSALSAGFERSGLGDTLNVEALRLGPKLWFDFTIKRAALRLGTDMLATMGKIYDERSRNSGSSEDGGGGFSLTDNPIYRSAAARNVVGAYAELNLPISRDWVLEAGLRGDTWITGGHGQAALEPRTLLRFQAKDWLALHAAFGTAYQPAVFLIPLPGISDVALDRGLQRAIQAEVGGRFTLPHAFSIENKLFAHFYNNMLSLDALDPADVECESGSGGGTQVPGMVDDEGMTPEGPVLTAPQVRCTERDGFARISARAYGSEWLIRRAFSEPVSGWLSYTLSKATARAQNGKALTPNFDVRHVANLVLQWRISRGWHVALRGVAQSGRFPLDASAVDDPRERARLPAFFRGDLQVSRTWQRRWGDLRVTFDWLNFTLQREPLNWNCNEVGPEGECRVEHVGFPITVPLLGLRASY